MRKRHTYSMLEARKQLTAFKVRYGTISPTLGQINTQTKDRQIKNTTQGHSMPKVVTQQSRYPRNKIYK
jgi:hypothetical protein